MRLLSGAALAAALVLSASSAVFAKGADISPADLAQLKSYTLSMAKIQGMQAAMDDAKKSGMDKKMANSNDNSQSLAEMETRIKAMPGAMAIFARHGLTAHDVVVMPFALMDAGMCVAYPSAAPKLADRVSPAQIAFYKAHKADLEKMKWLSGE
ncbi:MAG TPA: hypothetical protein VMF58_15165 [Rhizomicrobium sp.]|nr:hypothetical protein [Rhizomicrobium sp.]